MVAAGVFLVARVYPIFSLGAIDGVTSSLTVVVWIGVITALMAALIAIAQADIKRILAYSTVSQLGLMMVSLGVGGVAAGMMHLLAHVRKHWPGCDLGQIGGRAGATFDCDRHHHDAHRLRVQNCCCAVSLVGP